MRIVLLLLASFALASSFGVTSSPPPKLQCVLYADCTEYKIGEVPKLHVRIINEGNEDIYLVGSLDGSNVKWRMPYCYFTIQKPVRDSVPWIAIRWKRLRFNV